MDQEIVRRAIVDLLRQDVLTWDALEAIAHQMSLRGWGRAQIVDFFSLIMTDDSSVPSEEVMDFLGDFALHLIGQCNATQIVRLAGDPENVDELANLVCGQKWRRADSLK